MNAFFKSNGGMFESLVQNLLNRYLGAYVVGLNRDQLSVGVWQGKGIQ